MTLKTSCSFKNTFWKVSTTSGIFRLFGVAFLCLFLASTPQPSFASQKIYSSRDSSSYGDFTSYYYGGCLFSPYSNVYFDDYLVKNPYLMNRLSGSPSGCNYRVANNNVSYYSSTPVGTQKNTISQGSFTKNNFSFSLGYNPASWTATDSWEHGGNVRGVFSGTTFTNDRVNSQDIISSYPSNGYTGSSYALGFIKYSPDNPAWRGSVGTIPTVFMTGSISNPSAGNSPNDYIDWVNQDLHDYTTIVYGDSILDYFPNFDDLYCGQGGLGYVSCDSLSDDDVFVVFSYSVSPTYNLNINTIGFRPSTACDYRLSIEGSNSSCEDLDYMVNFLNYTPTYKSLVSPDNHNSMTSPFSGSYVNIDDQILYIQICDSKIECDNYLNYRNLYHQSRVDFIIAAGESGSSDSSNIFYSWFDIFHLNFLFPFGSLFNWSGQQCVEIPIIASWLSLSSDTEYCSWWSSSILDVTTPVIGIIAGMLLFGFVVRWLNSDMNNPTIVINKGGK